MAAGWPRVSATLASILWFAESLGYTILLPEIVSVEAAAVYERQNGEQIRTIQRAAGKLQRATGFLDPDEIAFPSERDAD
jgi:hypothetical protein